MSYTIQAIVGRVQVLAGVQEPNATVVAMPQGFAMIPLVENLRRALGIPSLPLTDEESPVIPQPLEVLIKKISKGGKVAYIEAEFFGGAGTQASFVVEQEEFEQRLMVGRDAINNALRCLGVRKLGACDEFEALKLGQNRCTDQWLGLNDQRTACANVLEAVHQLDSNTGAVQSRPMRDPQRQLLCQLYYPDAEFTFNKVALMAIDLDDWGALSEFLLTEAPRSALLKCISKDFPIQVDRERLHSISESINSIEKMQIPEKASIALFTLKMFIQQAIAQPKADILIDINSGEYIDKQTFLTAPVFDDVVEINRFLMKGEKTSGLWRKIKRFFGRKPRS